MIKLNNSYLGFTNNVKPLQKGKIEKSLDMMVRYNNQIMTEKEFVILKLQEGYTPVIEENYTTWSRKLDGMTKPKTLYKLETEDSYQEINKTLYNFSQYVIENNLTNDELINKYITEEQATKEELKQIEAKKQAEENELKRIEKEKDDQEREAIRQEKVSKWEQIGVTLLTGEIKSTIVNTIKNIYNEVIKVYPHITKDDWNNYTNEVMSNFPQQLGNYDYVQHEINYLLFESNVTDNIYNILFKGIYKEIFNISESESKQSVKSKIKAFYHAKQTA